MSAKAAKSGLEVEVKLKVRNLAACRQRLSQLGCVEHRSRSLEENWTWDFPDRRLRQAGQLLRVRRIAGQCCLTLKGSPIESRHFKVRDEFETGIEDLAVLSRVLRTLGLEVAFRYEKFRTSYSLKIRGCRRCLNIEVDETPIGNYLEIEGSQRDIVAVARKLGYRRRDFIKESYGTLFQRSRLGKRQRDMLFPGKR